MMRFLLKLNILLLVISLVGCGLNSPAKKPQDQSPNQQIKQVQFDPQLANDIKKQIKTINGVKDYTVVVMNKEISAAIKVTGFHRFRLKSIKEEVHQKIKDMNKDYTVRVTSDKKLFKELRQIEKQVEASPQKAPPDMPLQLHKINEDMQG